MHIPGTWQAALIGLTVALLLILLIGSLIEAAYCRWRRRHAAIRRWPREQHPSYFQRQDQRWPHQ